MARFPRLAIPCPKFDTTGVFYGSMTIHLPSKRSLVAAFCAVMAGISLGMFAMAAPQFTTISRGTAVRLQADRTVVTLVPAAKLRQGGRMFVTARGLTASTDPGVVYGVYLDLAAGAVPGDNDPHYVGTLGFYDTAPKPSQRFSSFDVTDALTRLGSARGGAHTITLIPRGKPLDGSDPAIAELALVQQ